MCCLVQVGGGIGACEGGRRARPSLAPGRNWRQQAQVRAGTALSTGVLYKFLALPLGS